MRTLNKKPLVFLALFLAAACDDESDTMSDPLTESDDEPTESEPEDNSEESEPVATEESSSATTEESATLGDSNTGSNETAGDTDGTEQTLCLKYGGAANVASVVQNNVIGAIAADCRINTFFTSLTPDGFTRVNDCLTIQVQELFGCEGIAYAGSEASNGLVCRDMTTTHRGLGISSADFDALIEDVVLGLTEAGVSEEDIGAAAPALLGMEPDIVEAPEDEGPTRAACLMGDAGTSDGDAGQ
jgi:hemoglobin